MVTVKPIISLSLVEPLIEVPTTPSTESDTPRKDSDKVSIDKTLRIVDVLAVILLMGNITIIGFEFVNFFIGKNELFLRAGLLLLPTIGLSPHYLYISLQFRLKELNKFTYL
jgi:hypothetical protein